MFRLQYPPGETSGQIILRSPELGNQYKINSGRVLTRNRSGQILSVFDGWPQVSVHLYSFSVIAKDMMDDLMVFLESYAGLKIRIIDHFDRTYDGYITTPVNEIVTQDDTCSYSINFEFEEDVS